MISDAHEGIKAAVARVFRATWKRCRVHFMRNALAHAGKSGRRVVAAFIATTFAQDYADAARAQWRQVADQVRPKLPKLATLLDEAELAALCRDRRHAVLGTPRLGSDHHAPSRWLAYPRALAHRSLPRRLIRPTMPSEPRRPISTNFATRPHTLGEVIRSFRFYLIVPTLVGASFTMTGLLFHQVHLTEVKGWALAWFASCFAAYAAASTASLIAFGALIDRLTAVRLMPFYLLPEPYRDVLSTLSRTSLDHS